MSRPCPQEGPVRLRDNVERPYWQGHYRVRSEDQLRGKRKSEKLRLQRRNHGAAGTTPVPVDHSQDGVGDCQTAAVGDDDENLPEGDQEAASKAAKIKSEILAGWSKKHPANVAASAAVRGGRKSSVDVSY